MPRQGLRNPRPPHTSILSEPFVWVFLAMAALDFFMFAATGFKGWGFAFLASVLCGLIVAINTALTVRAARRRRDEFRSLIRWENRR